MTCDGYTCYGATRAAALHGRRRYTGGGATRGGGAWLYLRVRADLTAAGSAATPGLAPAPGEGVKTRNTTKLLSYQAPAPVSSSTNSLNLKVLSY